MKFICMGIFSGIIGSMGLGGGTVLVPLLVFWGGLNQLSAQGINLIAFIPAAIVALISNLRAGRVDKKAAASMCLWGIIGAGIGMLIAFTIDESYLRKGFAVLVILLGIWQFIEGERRNKQSKK